MGIVRNGEELLQFGFPGISGSKSRRERFGTLIRRPVIKTFRPRFASHGLHNPVIADRQGCFQCFIHIARLQKVELLLPKVRPNTGKVIGLEFQPHRVFIFLSSLSLGINE